MVSYTVPNVDFSATGDIKILEVHPEGKYVRLVNTSQTKVCESPVKLNSWAHTFMWKCVSKTTASFQVNLLNQVESRCKT